MKHWLFRRITTLILLALLLSQTGCFEQPNGEEILSGGQAVLNGGVASVVPFDYNHRFIFLKARIGDGKQEYLFFVDTGAPTAVSQELARNLNLSKAAEIVMNDSSNSSRTVDVVVLNKLIVGEAQVAKCGAMVLDFHNLDSFGLKIDGILGGNFLNFFTVKIDYDQTSLTLTNQTGLFKSSALTYKVDLLPRSLGMVFAKLQIPGIKAPVDVKIDTGCNVNSYLLLPVRELERVKPALNYDPVKTEGIVGVFGGSEGLISRLSAIEIGDLNLSNLPVLFVNSPNTLLGNKFLSHFIVTIDYPRAKLYLTPYPYKMIDSDPLSEQ